ncbi:stage III sporulation protein AE [Paenibacillus alvei]|uniref:stage III sporulation protein AE n=1 Tax=Paenibacillus alvei TaxID=44250 RepID=UPI0018CEDF19|nr:stage III sporulation protein AE [Paenibacillus alvei]MBG9733766.1 stage III sporulation protein AE [Paenibacillus alvei]MBG9745691.1 stage III sporulation protein AE [Paenibacillus alvei]MCY9580487.1 stage III sporulation protein AE [Paenibacillus alvei]MCY9583187.1 stage III sporulation protein AE [Paenibacillus alvei]
MNRIQCQVRQWMFLIKKRSWILLLLCVLFASMGTAFADPTSEVKPVPQQIQDEGRPKPDATAAWVEEQTKRLQTGEVERYWNDLLVKYGGYFPRDSMPDFVDLLLPGGEKLTVSNVFKAIGKFMLQEVFMNGKLIVTIVILVVFSMVLETLQTAFERNTVSKIAYTISYMVIIILAINSFQIAIGYAKEAITSMINFMMAMIPLLLTLLASMGSMVTVTVMHPLIIFMVHMVGTLIYVGVFPLLFFSALLHIVSSISDKYKVTQLANLMRSISVGLLGVLLTIFLGVISVQGATSSVTDGVSIRTAKYITGNFVPVIGRAFSDATDTVVSASLLVKNAVGLSGVIILLFLCAFPAIKILTLALIYNASAAIMQPLGDSPVLGCLKTIGKSMIYVFAALAAVGLMFFLAITILITAGNVTVMMR